MMWDTHMHSRFSEGHVPQEAMIEAAKEKGLEGICFTEHMDIDYLPGPKLLDLPNYEAAVMALKEKNEGSLQVLFGMEVGLQPHLAATHSEIVNKYAFDFVIGSSHMLPDKLNPGYPEFWSCHEEEESYRMYFEYILENIKAYDGFDVYGHLDMILRHGPNKNQFFTYKKYADLLDMILKILAEKGKGIEVNTSGYGWGLGYPHPSPEILVRFRELGGEIITIGSDAHRPEEVARYFENVPEILKNAGFRYYTVFKERKPQFIRLEKRL